MWSPPTGAPNAGGVGRGRRIATNNLPYLGNGTIIDAEFLLKTNRKLYALLSNGSIADDLG